MNSELFGGGGPAGAAIVPEPVDDADDECGPGVLDWPAVRVSIIACYVGVFLVCLIGNLFTILVICAHRSMRTATNFFLANLALADLLVAIFCILQNMLHLVGTQDAHWLLGATLCKLYAFVLHLVPCTGIGILVCVSVEKYIVLHPLLALKVLTPRFRCALMASIWAVSVLFNLPYYTSAKHIVYASLGTAVCTRSNALSGWMSTRNMVTLSFVLWYCIPLAAIAFLYTRIGLVLWRSVPLKKLTQASALRTNSSETTTLVTGLGYASGKRSVPGAPLNHARLVQRGSEGLPASPLSLTATAATAAGTAGEFNLPLIRVRNEANRRSAATLMSEADDDDEEEGSGEHSPPLPAQQRPRVPSAISARASNATASATCVKNGGGATTATTTTSYVPQATPTTTGAILVSTMESRKKVIRLLIAIVCSFAILTLPHHARLVYTVWTVHPMCNSGLEALMQPGAYLLLFLSSSCNPFLYAFMSQRFRSAIRDIFACRRGRARRRRRSTRTRTQNSDTVGCTNGAAPAEVAGALLRHSSLTRLNLEHAGAGGALSGSERNLLMLAAARHRADAAGNQLKVQSSRDKKLCSNGGGSGGSASSATTASSMLYTNGHAAGAGGMPQMAVVYRKNGAGVPRGHDQQ